MTERKREDCVLEECKLHGAAELVDWGNNRTRFGCILPFFYKLKNLHLSVCLYNIHNVNCNILTVWQDTSAHDITCWEHREATVGWPRGEAASVLPLRWSHKRVCDSQMCGCTGTEPGLWGANWHVLLMASIAALEEPIVLHLM